MRKYGLWQSGVHVRWAALLVTLASCGGGTAARCPPSCPATYLGVILMVKDSTQGGALQGVAATLTGPMMNTMSCEPSSTATVCRLGTGPVIAGDYSLQVTATGFQPVSTTATIAVPSDLTCGCATATIEPSTVTLDPS
jgi:hypothetical protein